MIAKVRLQRKFKSKNQHSYASSICLIIKTQIVFELLVICFTCLLNLSLQFHLSHVNLLLSRFLLASFGLMNK